MPQPLNDFETHEADQLVEKKDLILHDASMNAWFSTALEMTKSIFTIASAGFGVVINLLYTASPPASAASHLWLMFGAAMFGLCAYCCILVFANNKTLLEAFAAGDRERTKRFNQIAKVRDFWSKATFAAGVVFVFISAVSRAAPEVRA